ncbi:MAG: 2-oxoisovalerate dehydrogenase [Rhodospirillales bacterium]|nr:2-oxoisovalerate dehydrogenase [Rhodospirillales bacterium]
MQGDPARNEIVFVVEDAPEGGFTARALGPSIFAEGDTLDDLRTAVRDAVHCHYDAGQSPKIIRLHFVRDEVLSA